MMNDSKQSQAPSMPSKPRPELLALAEQHGAKLTGKPDGSEAVTVVFTVKAWRAFDAALATAAPPVAQEAAPVGMTLRDYFAANALQGLLINSQGTQGYDWSLIQSTAAKLAYEFADAMLAAD